MVADPFNKQSLPGVVDGRDQPKVVTVDVENDSFGAKSAGGRERTLQLGTASPRCPFCFAVPSFQPVLHGFLNRLYA